MDLRESTIQTCQSELGYHQRAIKNTRALLKLARRLPKLEGVLTTSIWADNIQVYCEDGADLKAISQELRRHFGVLSTTRKVEGYSGKLEFTTAVPLEKGPAAKTANVVLKANPGATCRRVKVVTGTRVVEDFHYEVVCDGAVEPIAEGTEEDAAVGVAP